MEEALSRAKFFATVSYVQSLRRGPGEGRRGLSPQESLRKAGLPSAPKDTDKYTWVCSALGMVSNHVHHDQFAMLATMEELYETYLGLLKTGQPDFRPAT